MSQSQESKADAAQQRSEETRSFVRTVKAATRRRYTPEEKIRVVLEGFRLHRSLSMTCAGERGSSPTPTTRGPKSSWRLARRGLLVICPGQATSTACPVEQLHVAGATGKLNMHPTAQTLNIVPPLQPFRMPLWLCPLGFRILALPECGTFFGGQLLQIVITVQSAQPVMAVVASSRRFCVPPGGNRLVPVSVTTSQISLRHFQFEFGFINIH